MLSFVQFTEYRERTERERRSRVLKIGEGKWSEVLGCFTEQREREGGTSQITIMGLAAAVEIELA